MEVGLEQAVAPANGGNGRQHAATPRDVRRVVMRERRAAAWRNLHVLERDVIIVFSALCKVTFFALGRCMPRLTDALQSLLICSERHAVSLSIRHYAPIIMRFYKYDSLTYLYASSQMAARETGFGAVEAYMHQGKLLALDLIVRVRG